MKDYAAMDCLDLQHELVVELKALGVAEFQRDRQALAAILTRLEPLEREAFNRMFAGWKKEMK